MPEPWKISSIAEALPEFDHDTIRSMLAQCRWDINTAFSRLLDGDGSAPPSDDSPPPATNGDIPSSPTTGTAEPRNQTPGHDVLPASLHRGSSSRSSSRHSTASKRSANESDDDDPDPIRSHIRRRRGRGRDQKRRVLQDVTVGISVRDEDNENEVISIQLRVDPNTVAEQANGDNVNSGITGGSPVGTVSTSNSTGHQSDAEDVEGHARDHNNYSGRSPLSFGQNSEAMTDDGGSEYEDHAMASDSDDD